MRVIGTEPEQPLRALLQRYGLSLQVQPAHTAIAGSYWDEPEAGLVGAALHARPDTPLHSVLHEAAHFICMDDARRQRLHTDAGGDDIEECAVCYLQIVLADELGIGVADICADMDTWGYSFRLGNAFAWFNQDAADARAWLLEHGIIAADGTPTWRRR